jgi:hypothetical protein
MRQRFQPHLSDVQAARFAANLVSESLDHWRTRTYDCYQWCCLGIRY